VYNPLDPRHNPEVASASWRRSQSSASESSTPILKIQTITRRSLHKARSGLQALRAGIINHFSEDGSRDQNHVNPFSLGREEDLPEGSSVTVTSSTLDDAAFGTEIFRTRTPPRLAGNGETGSLHRVLSEFSDAHSFATVPELETKRKQRPCGDAVSTPGAKPTYATIHDSNPDLQPSGLGDLEAKTHLDDRIAHTTPSTDDHMKQSPWGVAYSANKENKIPHCDLAEPQSVWAGHWTTNPQGSSLSHASSDTQTSDDKLSSVPLSRQCSAEVKFAYPGIYLEMLEQCSRQHHSPNPNELVPRPSQLCPSGSQLEKTPNASPDPNERISPEDGAHSDLISSHEDHEGLIPLLPPQDPIPHFEELQPIHRPNPLKSTYTRHSSDRGSSITERTMPQSSKHDVYSSRYSTDELMSPDFASSEMTSMTNDTWSPLESEPHFPSPVEQENGYLLIEGKTSSQHPDRENQPTKPAQPIIIDCSIPIRDRPLNDLTSPEVLSPRLSSDGIPGAPFDFEEDTDDEFYPGIVQPRGFH
jgi:hypothetical protein